MIRKTINCGISFAQLSNDHYQHRSCMSKQQAGGIKSKHYEASLDNH